MQMWPFGHHMTGVAGVIIVVVLLAVGLCAWGFSLLSLMSAFKTRDSRWRAADRNKALWVAGLMLGVILPSPYTLGFSGWLAWRYLLTVRREFEAVELQSV